MAAIDTYVDRAMEEIRAILDVEHAVAQPEIEARVAEGRFAGTSGNIDPHHITSALRQMGRSREIIWDRAPARGGRHDIVTIQPLVQYRRTTKIANAAARKRLLMARYNGWAQGTQRHPQGLIGPAGEVAVRSAALNSGALQPAVPGGGPVSQLLGTTLPGPVDCAGYMLPFTDGIPGPAVTLLIEVKNIRSWVYPTSAELYQVLSKAATLQLAHPNQAIIPILVCRKAHVTTFWMAQQLGFVVIAMDRQYTGDVGEEELLEVRNELFFQDLTRGSEPSVRVHDRLRKTLPPICQNIAALWSNTCFEPGFAAAFEDLRTTSSTDSDERARIMDELRLAARNIDLRGGW